LKIEGQNPETQATFDYLSEQLRRTMATIDKKLASLEEETEKAQASLRELSEFYDKEGEKMRKYTLRGISTSSTTTYINRIEVSQDGAEMSLDTDIPKEQWWRITFDGQGSCPFSVYRVNENDVIEAARESQEPLLVYASEAAMQPCLAPLPEKLSAFVDKDNEAFRAEIPPAANLEEGSHFDNNNNWSSVPQSPGKRKYNEDGTEIEDEYRESPGRRGSMDVNFDAADGKEMVERSRSGPALPFMRKTAFSENEQSMDFDEVMLDRDAAEESPVVW